jgi:hypothetical protein
MIKKFEEFVNEMYSPRRTRSEMDRDFVNYLSEIGVSEDDCKEIYNIARKSSFYYTPEETENILKRLPGCDSIESIATAVKTIFFGTPKDFKEWCGDVKCPVVVGATGKLLTGVVIYVDEFDAYGEDFEDFWEMTSEYGARNGVLDDDLPDYNFFEDAIEGVDFYEVDLDKESGWTEK